NHGGDVAGVPCLYSTEPQSAIHFEVNAVSNGFVDAACQDDSYSMCSTPPQARLSSEHGKEE
ncbi:hypothetical protein, partial [Pseudomonas syringae]|uniref:hypothetical protein n=1 Tax=Pseudomonas syringae TaxID=317 RepID=UPI001F1F57C2